MYQSYQAWRNGRRRKRRRPNALVLTLGDLMGAGIKRRGGFFSLFAVGKCFHRGERFSDTRQCCLHGLYRVGILDACVISIFEYWFSFFQESDRGKPTVVFDLDEACLCFGRDLEKDVMG